jgi:hypothetical protein
VNVSRQAVYRWRDQDEEFKAAWIDAVETAMDVIETDAYKAAHESDVQQQQFLLKHRRKSVYGGGEDKQKQDDLFERLSWKNRSSVCCSLVMRRQSSKEIM